ncbi:PREDICTED: acid phosphatase 1-like isoform X2 [Ipomoea nil]|uniref:acid phosphatase 1-like isoform X2 n=1 Tax=Ipomoea nil TaxID=35883 RepID=UPI00090089FE|nr:PREDICTED: acid phosphatase 1-like isoform X2 [Ipomoea nil]
MQCFAICLVLISGATAARRNPTIKLPSALDGENLLCESWKQAVETNNAGPWGLPLPPCFGFAMSYMTGLRYLADSITVTNYALEFAKSVNVTGKDAWVFDVDDTLLSHVPHFFSPNQESRKLQERVKSEGWEEDSLLGGDEVELPALPASLELYRNIQKLGFKIFLLTGRKQSQLNQTVRNLLEVGYINWDRLILRDTCDYHKTALLYKSERRMELVEEGYTLHGNCGDQWSDLLGYAMAVRSFKLPNLMYYIK